MSRASKQNSILTLIGLDIEGEWNKPLLQNAAELSGASLVFVDRSTSRIEELRENFHSILACETGKRSRNIYDYPAPRGRMALIVGNELEGIPKEDLRRADEVVCVPMKQSQMSSVNVAVAAAISLYVLEKDLARKNISSCQLSQSDVDVLLYGADDPSELGSLLRSVWAFGWHRVFLHDLAGVWFTKDRKTIVAGRAAARSEKNPLVVVPFDQLRLSQYDVILLCNSNMQQDGKPLSRLRIPQTRRILVAFGSGELPFDQNAVSIERVAADYQSREVIPRYRHAGSTFLSYVSQHLRGN